MSNLTHEPVEFSLSGSSMSSGDGNSLSGRRNSLTRRKMFPLHQAAFIGNLSQVQNLLNKPESDPEHLVHELNSHHRTPLHECARGDGGVQSVKIAQELLSHVSDVKLKAYLIQVDKEACTALYYAVNNSNETLVGILLEAENKLEDSEHDQQSRFPGIKHSPKSLFLATATNGSIVIFKLLLRYGYKIQTNEHGEILRETILMKNSKGHFEIFKYLIDYLIQNETMEEIVEIDNKVKYILHFAAKHCHLEILSLMVNHYLEDFPILRKKRNFTPIHYVLKSWGDEKFFDCMRLLLEKCFTSGAYDEFVLYDELYNSKDSPLNFAFGEIRLKNAPYYVVEAMIENLPILSKKECWENVRRNEHIISRIYEMTPQLLPKLISKCAKIVNIESVQIDLGCVIPIQPSTETSFRKPEHSSSTQPLETRYLHKILGHDPMVQKSILLHPIVKIYLELKYKSFYAFNWFCCLIHILFLVCYSYVIPVKYSMCHDDDDGDKNSTSTCVNPANKAEDHINPERHTSIQEQFLVMIAILIILAVYIIPIGIKEIWQILRYRFSYFKTLINWVQLINLVFVILVCTESFFLDTPKLYILAAISGLLSWVLFLRELSKIFTECNIWTSALLKVVTRSIKLAIYFLPLLAGFYLVFRVLIPWRIFHYWLSGVGHMLILMTGEFEYIDTFNNDPNTSELQLFSATSSFLLFVMVIVISLSNLLVAVAVEDITKLRRDSEFKSLASRLENMYNLETVYESLTRFTCIKGILKCCDYFYHNVLSQGVLKLSNCFCTDERVVKTRISYMSLEIPNDGMLNVPRTIFSEQELKDMNLI